MLNLNCVICTDLFEHADDVRVITCGHLFHVNCINTWLQRSSSCPQCRNHCTKRNLIRVYFNIANSSDASRIDVSSLHEQIDNAKLDILTKTKTIKKLEDDNKELKKSQKKAKDTISGLEKTSHRKDILLISMSDQLRMVQTEAKKCGELRKELSECKEHIVTLEGAARILSGTSSDVENLLKTQRDPVKLATWISNLKRELQNCQNSKEEARKILQRTTNDLRKETEINRELRENISIMESENYQLNQQIQDLLNERCLELDRSCNATVAILNKNLNDLKRKERRATISPISKIVKNIEATDSPYFNIKSSSLGLTPLLKHMPHTKKISPRELLSGSSGTVGRQLSDPNGTGEKWAIFKKPRIAQSVVGSAYGVAKPLDSIFSSRGIEKLNNVKQFETIDDKLENEDEVMTCLSARSKTNLLNKRLKLGSLCNFKQ